MNFRITEMWITLRKDGLRAAFKKFGWQFVALVVVYYLIRDTLIYIVLPFLAWRMLS